MAADASRKSGKKGEAMSQEKVLAQFQQMRQEQRAIANKITDLEADKNEHTLVIRALKDVDGERRCFRMVGGVLMERTVKDVLPALQHNCEQITVLVTKLMEQLQQKGKELNEFREKHNIKLKGESERSAAQLDPSKGTGAQGVLVS